MFKSFTHTPVKRKLPEVKCGYCGGVWANYITPEYQQPIDYYEDLDGNFHSYCAYITRKQVVNYFKGATLEEKVKSVSNVK